MKKKFILIIITILCLFVTSCNVTKCDGCFGNKTTFDFTLTYENALVKIGDEWVDLQVIQWNDYEGEQIQLQLKDGTILLVHSANCILYSGELPKV